MKPQSLVSTPGADLSFVSGKKSWCGMTEAQIVEHLASAQVPICKNFPGSGLHRGQVVSSDGSSLTVVYEDGDSETMTLSQVAKLLPRSLNARASEFLKGEFSKSAAKAANTAGGGGSVGKKDKDRDSKHAHINVHHGQKWKGGAEQRVNRVGSFEAALLEIEEQGGIIIYRNSELSMRKRKMALNVDRIVVTEGNFLFYKKMNEVLRLPQDRTDDNTKLCSGVRETMRYLGLLPSVRGEDKRFDWACGEFAFNDEAREERLARAILTHKRSGGCRGGGSAEGQRGKESLEARPGQVSQTASGTNKVMRTLPKVKERRIIVEEEDKEERKKRKGQQVKQQCEDARLSADRAGKRRRMGDESWEGDEQMNQEGRSSSSRPCFGGLIWVKKGLIRGGVKFRQHLLMEGEQRQKKDLLPASKVGDGTSTEGGSASAADEDSTGETEETERSEKSSPRLHFLSEIAGKLNSVKTETDACSAGGDEGASEDSGGARSVNEIVAGGDGSKMHEGETTEDVKHALSSPSSTPETFTYTPETTDKRPAALAISCSECEGTPLAWSQPSTAISL